MFTGVLKHMPPPSSTATATPSASEKKSNAHTTIPTIPRGHLVVGSSDHLHLLTPVGSTGTSTQNTMAGAHIAKHSGAAPQPPSSTYEKDDRDGRTKRKQNKKDKRKWDKGAGEVEGRDNSKPKKRREEKEVMITLRKNKESKEGKESRTKGKDDRKRSKTELKNAIGGKEAGAVVSPISAQVSVKIPGRRGRKPKVLPPVATNEGIVLMAEM